MPSDNESEESEEIILKHFNDMDEILGKRESIDPCHMLESSHVPNSESPEMSELERDILKKDALDEEICQAAQKQRQGTAQNVSPPSECTVPSNGDESNKDQLLAFAESLFFTSKGKNKKPSASTPVLKRHEADGLPRMFLLHLSAQCLLMEMNPIKISCLPLQNPSFLRVKAKIKSLRQAHRY